MGILVAAHDLVLRLDPRAGVLEPTRGLTAGPTCLAAAPASGRAWCGTDDGVYRSDDGGESWTRDGLDGEEVTAIAADPTDPGAAWAGTEPSAVFRRNADGPAWERLGGLRDLPSSSEWSFPPRPETHHVRWIAPHPTDPGRLWVAIEAGALVRTPDGGDTWRDRAAGAPYDTHEIAIHPARSGSLRIAAGDGYYESDDGGESWRSPEEGLEVGYLRSVAIDPGDPEVVIVSAASRAHSAYTAGRSNGRIYRRAGRGTWRRVTREGQGEQETIAPLLAAGRRPGELWAGDERGVHLSTDGGRSWERTAAFEETPSHLRGLAVVGS